MGFRVRSIASVDVALLEDWFAQREESPHAIPQELANIVQTGRIHGLELLTCTQRPNRLNGAITNEVTELVSFQLLEPSALDRMEALGADRAAVATLPKGWFISYNVDSGAEQKGRVF